MSQQDFFLRSLGIKRRRHAPRWMHLSWHLLIGVAVIVAGVSSAVAGSADDPQRAGAPIGEELAERFDPGILPLAELSTEVSLPKELDGRGELLPMPIDHAKAYFAEPSQDPSWHFDPSFWPEYVGYGPSLNFAYRPLYFEQAGVERYGCSFGYLLQPGVSTLHFYTSAALLPYRMVTQPPLRPVYHDHPDLPGGSLPHMRPRWLPLRR